jgi:hypothetical protein
MSEIRATDLVKVNPGSAVIESCEMREADLVKANLGSAEVGS